MIVLITGASSGFGRAIAKKFGENGHKVIALARRKERLESLQREIPQCEILPCDICDKVALKNSLASLPKEFQSIDVLVNNAGLALGIEPAQICDFDDWERMIAVNISALSFLTHLILPQMVERKSGHIITLGSIAGKYPYPGGNVYGATKAFVRQFALGLRADLAGTNVRVSDIEPGLAESEFSLVRFKGDEERAKALYKGSNALQPQDIAEAVYWVSTLPKHVNINTLEMMPTTQSFSALSVHKE
ncbi:SDR family oxidoreductase [Helicobacter sp. MIT 11-5569]|uniref:SDR family oxidoreductase n=1 Tax=Helicobacter sp. MIT 11-5569 TaxID=1548151 RepID=UPI0010FD5891|nr:SDR family oxidoreductase [Helicobacter sp. MIT 11-5569]TLD85367.1 SDR family oxidoreductase [Helicobacter sp. MIT 11-5569]